MLHYLKNIISTYTNHQPCALLLDSYTSHITDNVYKLANKLKIESIIVPCSMTSTLAPLDVGVNGILKSIYTKHWRQVRLFEKHETDKTLPWSDAVKEAEYAYARITTHAITSSFTRALQFPPSSDHSIHYYCEQEQITHNALEKQKHKDNPPLLSSRNSQRVANKLADPCVNDASIARALVEDFDDDT
jgi:hypothetical protein